MTACTHVAVLPLLSVTVQVTKLVPTGKLVGALLVSVVVPQLSALTGVPRLTLVAEHKPADALTVTLVGQVIEGGCVSFTMTVCTQVLVLPLLSVTVQVTKLVLSGKFAGAFA